MRALKIVLALLLAALLASCGNGDSPTADPTEAKESPPATQAASGETIPDGTYAKSVTVTDAEEAGITDEDFLGTNFGPDGTSSFSFKFDGNAWTLFVIPGGGAPEPGDVGSLTYDEDGNAVMTSASEGCPGCVGVYDWQLEGDELALTIVEHDSSDKPEDLAITRFVTEGTFTGQP